MTHPITGITDCESASAEEFYRLSCCAFDGMAILEPDPWRIRWANPAFWQVIGIAQPESRSVVGVADLPEQVAEQLRQALHRFFENARDTTALELSTLPITDGQRPAIRLCCIGSGDERTVGMVVHLNASISSVSHSSSDASRIDPLTGLPDRAALLDRLATLLHGERACDRQFALLFLDLDNFKHVNDEFGHLVGDMVLREAARRIAESVREGDTVARYGGDEFVALIDGATAMEDVQLVVERIRVSLDRPIVFEEGDVRLSLSTGVAFASEESNSPEALLGAADQAMYVEKRATAALGKLQDG